MKIENRRNSKPGKLQSAMEYLMTYGWSILIIAIVIAAVFELGVFGSGNTAAPKAQPGNCRVFRPNGPSTTANLNLEGICSGELPEYVAQFNGVNNYVKILTSPSLRSANTITVVAWIKDGYTGGNQQAVISDYGGTSNSVTIFDNPSKVFVFELLSPSGSTGFVGSSYYLDDGNWHQLVGVRGGGTISTYIDGKLQGSESDAIGNISNFYNWDIGAELGGGGYYFNGTIANVQVYNGPLDQNSVVALYSEGIGGAPINLQNLVAWWPLNGDTNDYSGNGNNGAPTGVVFTSSWTSGYSVN